MKRYCLALDLKEDPALIAEYEKWHRQVWVEIKKSITDSGVLHMEIWRLANRLFMVMDTEDTFNPEAKAMADASNPVVQQWEELMWKFQQPLPWAHKGQKWVPMEKIFDLRP